MKKKGQILAERFDDVANELLRNPETKISFEKERKKSTRSRSNKRRSSGKAA